ncbi:MAG: glycosyltransferase family 2 protein [Deltaproteobacteria bacterium]|nr:glycosyltransferase family 2 protein [Deltaproteobacteria bacterium]
MTVVPIFWLFLGILLALATFPGTVELLLVTIGGILPPRKKSPSTNTAGRTPQRFAVVVPAHNEEGGIQRCVTSLRACEPLGEYFSIVVVADNCTDATAARAHAAGARVLERRDLQNRGKGYALDFAFNLLLAEGIEAVVVVDADTVVEPNLLSEFRRLFANGADAIQARYCVQNPEASIRTRLMNVALLAFNVLRLRGRERWGLSVGILGNGFALTRDTLCAVPYDARSVVEDLEYHLRLVRRGYRVRFADATSVRGEMPTSGSGVTTQRARWEGGRFRMIAEVAPSLFKEVLSGRLTLLEPLLELLLLPLAFHVTLLLFTLLPPVVFLRLYAGVALNIVLWHILAGIWVGNGSLKDVAALAFAPVYVLWKIALIPALLRSTKKATEWIRTERTHS